MELRGKRMELVLNRNLEFESEIHSVSVEHALGMLRRDLNKVCVETDAPGIRLKLERGALEPECFSLRAEEEKRQLTLCAGSDLGFIYGICEISRTLLGVTDFWFWNDWQPERREAYPVPEHYGVSSGAPAVRFRGWFINDEVLLQYWSVDFSRELPWEMAFEALLRCGGNMVIPGTDKNSRKYRKLASDMGLYVTHHHAEPLGAELFSRAYPGLEASFDTHEEKFRGLWEDGIRAQEDLNVIWNLGFRGQGDRPFWEDDPAYDTPKKRGELIGQLIAVQYRMVKERQPEAVCCTNLYGEVMELYRDGHLELPDDVIRIWADNGYGKMITRRQGNHNPRIPALPKKDDTGKNGIYYHVSFYDLQAASHITELANEPEFVRRELLRTLECGCSDYWIINGSNIKPHAYYLDLIAALWRNGDVDVEEHRRRYAEIYYGAQNAERIADCLRGYHQAATAYGPNEDEHAGEQFATHVGRMLVSRYMKGTTEASEDLLWMADVKSLRGQIRHYEGICKQGRANYRTYLRLCERTAAQIIEEAPERLFADSLLLQAKLLFHCFAGSCDICTSLFAALDRDYRKAFFYAGKAREAYLAADHAMREREHGKWDGFYANECLSDVKQSAWVLAGYMSYVRNLDEGPDFHTWQRELTYSKEDRRVMLILMTENHLPDDDIYRLMKKRELFSEEGCKGSR